jgi:nucleotide-binding universal stress UspA family protein
VEIVSAAERLRPDLIVMATHGRKGLDALMSGSVGTAISKASPVCLLIAPITPSPA